MFPKKNRVRKRIFKQILNLGRSFHSPHLSLRILNNKNEGRSRFSVVISKQVEKKATGRNLLKRRAYFSLKELSPKIKNPHILILFFKKGADRLSFTLLKKEINFLAEKSGIFLF